MNENHLMPKVGQYALVSNDEGKALILERARSRTWCLAGGRLNEDEEWDSALLRELQEELGLKCNNPKPFAVYLLKDDYQTKYCVYFTLNCSELKTLRLSVEHSDLRWVGLDTIENFTFEDEKVKEVVKSYLESL